MKILNTENLILLSTLLNESDINDLLIKADVLRNLGRFEESRQLLNRIEDNELGWIKDKFLTELIHACENKQISIEDWFKRISQPISVCHGGSTTIHLEGNPEGSQQRMKMSRIS